MGDLTLKHLLAFAIFFIALFAVLFVGVIEVHSRNTQRHATAHYTPASHPAAPAN
jgi:predicted secreted protein